MARNRTTARLVPQMALLAASILQVSSLAVLLLAATATAAPATGGDGDTMVARGNSPVTSLRGDTEMYICYLCTGRNPMLIRYCPIYWDECHLECYAPAATAVATASSPPPVPAVPRENYGEECYVMKLYQNGTYVIVSRRNCSQIARCLLSCGGGDVADTKALGAAARPVSPTAPHRILPSPRVADFQRCGTQARLPRLTTVPGGVERRLGRMVLRRETNVF